MVQVVKGNECPSESGRWECDQWMALLGAELETRGYGDAATLPRITQARGEVAPPVEREPTEGDGTGPGEVTARGRLLEDGAGWDADGHPVDTA